MNTNTAAKEALIMGAYNEYNAILIEYKGEINRVRASIVSHLADKFKTTDSEDAALLEFEKEATNALNFSMDTTARSFGFSLRQLMKEVELK